MKAEENDDWDQDWDWEPKLELKLLWVLASDHVRINMTRQSSGQDND